MSTARSLRSVNEARRKEGLHVTDRIHLVLWPSIPRSYATRSNGTRITSLPSRCSSAGDVVIADNRPVDGHRIEHPMAVIYVALSARKD